MAVMGKSLTQSRKGAETAEKVRLGEVVKIIGGGTPSKKRDDFYKGDIPWATVRDMNCDVIRKTEYCITSEAVENSATNIIPSGEVVISTHVGLGKVCILGQDTAINQDLKAIIPDKGICRPYLFYWFCSQANNMVRNGKGATVKGVTLDFVRALEIPLPSLKKQKRIAATLDRICELKKNAETRLAKLDILVKSRFVEMFGDVQERVRLSDEASLITKGTTPTSVGFSFQECGINFIKIETIEESGEIVLDKIAHIGEDCHQALRRSQLEQNDILFSIAGAIGRVMIVPKEILPANTNQALAIIRLKNSSRLDVGYLACALKSPMIIRQYTVMQQGVAQANVSLRNVSDFIIPLPPLALQREFATFVAKVDKLALSVRKTVEQMDVLYRSKLQEYFG